MDKYRFYILDIIKDIIDDKLQMILTCKSEEGKNAVIRIIYQPYFYIRPYYYKDKQKVYVTDKSQDMIEQIQKIIFIDQNYKQQKFQSQQYIFDQYVVNTLQQKKTLWGYQYESQKYIKMKFKKQSIFEKYKRKIQDLEKNILKIKIHNEEKNQKEDARLLCEVVEEHIDLQIHFINDNDIQICGWNEVDIQYLQQSVDKQSQQYNVDEVYDLIYDINNEQTPITKINLIKDPEILICSYDIETTSGQMDKFPNQSNYSDRITQIACVFGDLQSNVKKIYLIGDVHLQQINMVYDCEIQIIKCKYEIDIVKQYFIIMIKENPDIVMGYNIYGFDDRYINHRAKIYQPFDQDLQYLEKAQSRIITSYHNIFETKIKESMNIGTNEMKYYNLQGQIRMDVLYYMREMYKYMSYKLDFIAPEFINGKITDIYYDDINKQNIITTTESLGLQKDMYIRLIKKTQINSFQTQKYKILQITTDNTSNKKTYKVTINKEQQFTQKYNLWTLVKDDISPKQLFQAYQQSEEHPLLDEDFSKQNAQKIQEKIKTRTAVGHYCIMDCILVYLIAHKIKLVRQSMQMANLCGVPYRYIFTRAQGVKILSLVLNETKKTDVILPKPEQQMIKYMGAFVLDAYKGFYSLPIIVLDYSSLYPSCMITYNLSPDSLLTTQQIKKYNLLKDIDYNEIYIDENTIFNFHKKEQGLYVRILDMLLKRRKEVRKYMEINKQTLSELEMTSYDIQQQTIKIVANSMYGLTGGKGDLFCPEVAQSTTACGRKAIQIAVDFSENTLQHFFQEQNEITKFVKKYELPQQLHDEMFQVITEINKTYTIKLKTVYGDTDSIFVYPQWKALTGQQQLSQQDLIKKSIQLGLLISQYIKYILKGRLNLEFEKVLCDFILYAKKHYVGWLYDDLSNLDNRKLKISGIILKRRDNAGIVKFIYRELLTMAIEKKLPHEQIVDKFLQILSKIITNKYDKSLFIITKSLNSQYANPEASPHYVLSERLKKEKGMQFTSNERIPFLILYDQFKSNCKDVLLGQLTEHPEFFDKQIQQLDFLYYINRQIKKPCMELLEAILPEEKYIYTCIKLDEIVQDIYVKRYQELQQTFQYVIDNSTKCKQYINFFKYMINYTHEGKINKQDFCDKFDSFIDSKIKAIDKQKQKQLINSIQIATGNRQIRVVVQYIYKYKKQDFIELIEKYNKSENKIQNLETKYQIKTDVITFIHKILLDKFQNFNLETEYIFDFLQKILINYKQQIKMFDKSEQQLSKNNLESEFEDKIDDVEQQLIEEETQEIII